MSGARPSASETGRAARALNTWGLEHARVFVSTLGSIARNPFGATLAAAVIGIALALPAGLYTALSALERVVGGWAMDAQITLYLRPAVDGEAARKLGEALAARSDVAETEFIDRAAALMEFKQWSGFAAGLDALDANPLPHVVVVYPERTASDAGIEALQQELGQLPTVEAATLDRQWLRRLSAFGAIAQRAIVVLGCVLGIAVVLVVGNTIRLGIAERAEEIEISQLFGATDDFIRRPFTYQGALVGGAGGLLAAAVVGLGSHALEAPVQRLASLYGAHFDLAGLDLRVLMVLTGLGACLGLVGSWLTVNAHLRRLRQRREA